MPPARSNVDDPAIDAGDLNRRVTLLAPVYSEFEDEITDWQAIGDVFAAVNPAYGQEQTEAGRTVSIIQTPIVIRYRSDVDARWRISGDGKLWRILGIVNLNNRNVQLQLNCREVE